MEKLCKNPGMGLSSNKISLLGNRWKYYNTFIIWLVVSTPLKNISQLGRIIPYIMENKKCSKPPTRYYIEGSAGSNLSSSFLAVVAVATSTWEPLQKTPRTVAENNTRKLLQNTAPLQKTQRFFRSFLKTPVSVHLRWLLQKKSPVPNSHYPLVICYIAMERSTIFQWENPRFLWAMFQFAMLPSGELT